MTLPIYKRKTSNGTKSNRGNHSLFTHTTSKLLKKKMRLFRNHFQPLLCKLIVFLACWRVLIVPTFFPFFVNCSNCFQRNSIPIIFWGCHLGIFLKTKSSLPGCHMTYRSCATLERFFPLCCCCENKKPQKRAKVLDGLL